MLTHFSIAAGKSLSEEEAKRFGEVLNSVAKGLMPTARLRIMRTATLAPERKREERAYEF
ncbi:hypothetical protein [Streptomyces pseudogriseolus]|uniref:hypothetical protein n=1 Tax=Streptomyces pseudogriseolus TaxID=36817 RepID=UPI003FA26B5A